MNALGAVRAGLTPCLHTTFKLSTCFWRLQFTWIGFCDRTAARHKGHTTAFGLLDVRIGWMQASQNVWPQSTRNLGLSYNWRHTAHSNPVVSCFNSKDSPLNSTEFNTSSTNLRECFFPLLCRDEEEGLDLLELPG